MAIDLCSENSVLGMSPRISFSHDLCQKDVVPIEHYHRRSDSSLLESSSDFDFCVSKSFEQESSSADELFSDGKILPTQIRKKIAPPKQIHQSKPSPPPPPNPNPAPATENAKKESSQEINGTSSESEEKPQSKSFWGFKRSSSLNCGNGYKRSLICSLPLLSRSNSTGSAPTPKRSQKHPSIVPSKSSSTSYSYPSSQKPPLKKNYGGSYNNGVRINPVLNVPPPYISKGTAYLFGLGSFFCNGKDKSKKK
ncbi:hypothetical protein HHK36_014969 [Tetracentron sinense]|uniref:Uncharacterized protein n=1 Tax=Tetracentron sinense TaxID=13715 RepID=A0A835DD73_TETSI|nr:hypothetical protein HHK36_014969 [Tetracentron sinense]